MKTGNYTIMLKFSSEQIIEMLREYMLDHYEELMHGRDICMLAVGPEPQYAATEQLPKEFRIYIKEPSTLKETSE